MEGWIKLGKGLPSHPIVRRLAADLARRPGAEALPFEYHLSAAVGAVSILWITADGHIDQNDVLALGPDDIDRLTGIQGLCKLLPNEWLEVLDAHHVKLPGFQAHNGPAAKARAQATRRQQGYRNGAPSRKRH